MISLSRGSHLKNRLLSVLAVGISFLFGALLISNWHNWIPVSMRINLDSNVQQYSPSFQTDIEDEYLVELEVERNIPFEEINCLLGVASSTLHECSGIQSVIDLEWAIISSGVVVSSGTSRQEKFGAWGDKISRIVGRFNSEKNREYELRFRLLKDASSLRPTNPKMVVRVHPIRSKGFSSVAYVFCVVGLACVFLGGAFIYFLVRLRRS